MGNESENEGRISTDKVVKRENIPLLGFSGFLGFLGFIDPRLFYLFFLFLLFALGMVIPEETEEDGES